MGRKRRRKSRKKRLEELQQVELFVRIVDREELKYLCRVNFIYFYFIYALELDIREILKEVYKEELYGCGDDGPVCYRKGVSYTGYDFLAPELLCADYYEVLIYHSRLCVKPFLPETQPEPVDFSYGCKIYHFPGTRQK